MNIGGRGKAIEWIENSNVLNGLITIMYILLLIEDVLWYLDRSYDCIVKYHGSFKLVLIKNVFVNKNVNP